MLCRAAAGGRVRTFCAPTRPQFLTGVGCPQLGLILAFQHPNCFVDTDHRSHNRIIDGIFCMCPKFEYPSIKSQSKTSLRWQGCETNRNTINFKSNIHVGIQEKRTDFISAPLQVRTKCMTWNLLNTNDGTGMDHMG